MRKKEYKVFGSKNKYTSKYWRDITITIATALSLAKKKGGSTADTSRAYSNGGSREYKYSYSVPITVGRIHAKT